LCYEDAKAQSFDIPSLRLGAFVANEFVVVVVAVVDILAPT
jgi:hypothetical protein